MSDGIETKAPGLDWKFHALPVLDLVGATAKLRKGEKSSIVQADEMGLVSRYDTIQLASNEPNEDYMVSGSIDLRAREKWHCWGVYDGHGGRHTAAALSHALISYVERSLKTQLAEASVNDMIGSAFITAFQTLDSEICADGLAALEDAKTHAEVQSRLAPCYAGSCALLVAYDPTSSSVHIANTGDSRAVLGRRSTESQGPTWVCVAASHDHAAADASEAERVKALHPDEKDLITKKEGDCERYVGIAVTRAFGDARWKWPKEIVERCVKEYSGKPTPPNVVNPPYLEATPEVTSVEVKKGDFLILASDGLWNHLSSEDAVLAVGMWIEAMESGGLKKTGEKREMSVDGGPAVSKAEGISFEEFTKIKPECFVVEDENVATHLVRNAFGGGQRQRFTGVMTVDAPQCRTMRDDMTVQVVFFG